MTEHEEDIDECIHSINKCDKCIDQSKTGNQVKCNQCGQGFQNKNEIENHLRVDHKTYRPCKKYAENNCEKEICRFSHKTLQHGEEVCYKCGDIYTSKTDLINHIKTQHGMVICHKFLKNECSRTSDECIFSHKTMPNRTKSSPPLQQQVFRERPTAQAQRPVVGMQTMSEHIQIQQQLNRPQMGSQPQIDIMNMIPQIVAQVVAALTQIRI